MVMFNCAKNYKWYFFIDFCSVFMCFNDVIIVCIFRDLKSLRCVSNKLNDIHVRLLIRNMVAQWQSTRFSIVGGRLESSCCHFESLSTGSILAVIA